jgi:hypothetical protein
MTQLLMWKKIQYRLINSYSLFLRTEKDLYCTKHSTNPFYKKDPGDYTNYKENTTKDPNLHLRSPPPTTLPIQAGEAMSDDAGKKTTYQDRSTAPRIGIAATVNSMSHP